MKTIYVDNAATTAASDSVVQTMARYWQGVYGNPSSLHTVGQIAKEELENARARIAKCLNATPREIYFTSGGSEADNQAIYTAAVLGEKKGKKHIITTTIEHHAVLHPLKKLQKQGFEVTYLPVSQTGLVTPEQVEAAIRPDTALVTIMYANNEVGTIEPIRQIGEVCRKHKVLFHTDAVQAVGHIPVDVEADNIDMLSLSAHKFHGPKGVGVLYCRKTVAVKTFIEGGAQERGKRAGTENLPAICGLAQALEDALCEMPQVSQRLTALRDRLMQGLKAIPYAHINGDLQSRLPGNVNICFEGIEGESLLLLLDQKGICASSGSACTSGSLDPSHVLLALGLVHEVAHGSLRLSLSVYNTAEEVEYIITEVPKIVAYLREISPVWEELEKGERKHIFEK